MGPKRPRPVVLDAGALIAVDRADRRIVRLLELAEEVHVPAGALAQAWRNPARQVRLVRVVRSADLRIHPLDAVAARAAGQVCAASGTADVIDATVVIVARAVDGVAVTSDPDDLRRIDPAEPATLASGPAPEPEQAARVSAATAPATPAQSRRRPLRPRRLRERSWINPFVRTRRRSGGWSRGSRTGGWRWPACWPSRSRRTPCAGTCARRARSTPPAAPPRAGGRRRCSRCSRRCPRCGPSASGRATATGSRRARPRRWGTSSPPSAPPPGSSAGSTSPSSSVSARSCSAATWWCATVGSRSARRPPPRCSSPGCSTRSTSCWACSTASSRPAPAWPACSALPPARELSFGYGAGPDVLHGVDLRVAPGQHVAVVGPTGSGKSTLAALLAGQRTPRRGAVTLAGTALPELDPAALHRTVALVTQEVHVFAGTVADNLRLVRPDADDARLEAVLTAVAAHGWVRTLPAGLDTPVGAGGHPLSASQAQHLALARLVLLDPAVVILDEATAEAGSDTARLLDAAAARAVEGRTALVVAHRLGQATAAEAIVVLREGAVHEQGSHDRLAAAGGEYARLWRAWAVDAPSRQS